jgi:hypothetical protein
VTPERLLELMRKGGELTREEWQAGYHFCPAFDNDICSCNEVDTPAGLLCQWCDFDGTQPYPGDKVEGLS